MRRSLVIVISVVALVLPLDAGSTPAGTCKLTRDDSLGPFYVANAPRRTSIGKGHVLTGVVRSSKTCRAIPGARIEFWQAGPDARYDAAHRATLFARRNGAYRFESSFPPPYSGRPSHIHVRVSARGYRTLVTQYYPRSGEKRGVFNLVLVRSG